MGVHKVFSIVLNAQQVVHFENDGNEDGDGDDY